MTTARRDHSVDPTAFTPELAPIPWDYITAYQGWCRSQPVPVISGFHIPDITAVETSPWDVFGAEGAIVDLWGTAQTNGSCVVKLNEGEATAWLRRIFEEVFYVVTGKGEVELKVGGRTWTSAWRAGSVFSIPLNREYRLIAEERAVFYSVNTAPLVMSLFHDRDFVFNNPFEFSSRTPGERDPFFESGKKWRRRNGGVLLETNMVNNISEIDLPLCERRGGGGHSMSFQLGESTLASHVSDFATGAYKKAHRHGPGAHVVLLSGNGYSLLWEHAFDQHQKVEWRRNSVFVPPNYWWHQHFNVGTVPARYLALRWGSDKFPLDQSYGSASRDRRGGGNQIEYDDQDPLVHSMFARECERHGVEVAKELMTGKGAS